MHKGGTSWQRKSRSDDDLLLSLFLLSRNKPLLDQPNLPGETLLEVVIRIVIDCHVACAVRGNPISNHLCARESACRVPAPVNARGGHEDGSHNWRTAVAAEFH